MLAFATPAYATTTQEAHTYVDDIGREALGILGKNTLSAKEKQTILQDMFKRHVDIKWIGKFVLGRFWRQATPEQQANYLREYETFLVSHYTSHFADYSGGGYTITDTKSDGDNRFIVSMRLEPKGQPPIVVEYRLRESEDGKLRVYDIIIEGVSLITTQRSEFTSVAQNKGLDALIEQLSHKAAPAPATANGSGS